MLRTTDHRLSTALRSNAGYTLIELIVAAGIFILIAIVAVAVLVSILGNSTKTASQRSVQQDVRVNVEEIARTVRASSIDYTFYEKADAQGQQVRCGIDDTPGSTTITGSKALPLVWSESVPGGEPEQKRVIFFYDATEKAVYRYETPEANPTPTCAQLLTFADKVRLTGAHVEVTAAKFFVSPLTDPYGQPCPGAVPVASCQLPRNTHPRVTMLMTVKTLGAAAGKDSETTVQTTIGSRAYPISEVAGQGAPSAPPTPPPPASQTLDGEDFVSCNPPADTTYYYCQTNDPDHPNAVYSLSGGGGNPDFVVRYLFSGASDGTYRLQLRYYNLSLGNRNPPPGYSYRIKIDYPGGSRTVTLPIESTDQSQDLHTFTVNGLPLTGSPTITLTWDNDDVGNGPPPYDANFGLDSIKLTEQ